MDENWFFIFQIFINNFFLPSYCLCLCIILYMVENLLWHESHEKEKNFQPFRQMVLELSKIWNWLAINHQYMSGYEEKSIWHFYIWIAKYLLIFFPLYSRPLPISCKPYEVIFFSTLKMCNFNCFFPSLVKT